MPADHIAIGKLAKSLVGVDCRESQRIGNVLLVDRQPAIGRHPRSDCPLMKERQKIGCPFEGGAAADAQQMFIQNALLA